MVSPGHMSGALQIGFIFVFVLLILWKWMNGVDSLDSTRNVELVTKIPTTEYLSA